MRYLAIDYGTKHTGLAICDLSETIVSPLAVIEGQRELAEKIADIARTENVGAIVLGLPLNMDNSEGAQAKLTLEFAEQLKKRLDIPIHYQDERLSSFGAEDKRASAELSDSSGRRPGRSRKGKKRKKRLDALAAADILEAFLEQKNT